MQIQIHEASVQAALIGGTASVIATALGAICAAIIGKQIAWSKRQREKHDLAISDIAFLLAVEAAHCDRHRVADGESHKLRVREEVRAAGYSWSGRFTPSRAHSVKPTFVRRFTWSMTRRQPQKQA
ncbi:hypothetical protein VI03_31000 [Burkholderia vietnamiensis]|uniref:hypothetical protein n=1 Tax=Burkholderia vietnamiensis TaxID=60552 RepID=UPI000621FFDD|nr:hypothetical protein [Burkholderia vietnamiensis]KKI34968.1 hypothetical protein VI03_31000 [Burkholderia vietnamiensis]